MSEANQDLKLVIRLTPPLRAALDEYTEEHRLSRAEAVRRILQESLADQLQTDDRRTLRRGELPARAVVVRLAPKVDPSARAGYVEGMDHERLWEAAHGFWKLSERSIAPYLAAAAPNGRIEAIWRVNGWAVENNRRFAVGPTRLTGTNGSPVDREMFEATVGHFVGVQRNPVYIF